MLELNKLLRGNILVGSRSLGLGKVTSDWDIICTTDTLNLVLKEGDIVEHSSYDNGYDIVNEVGSDTNIDEDDYEDCDNGGFGADLESIEVITFKSGLKINLFVYPSKKKWKAYKKLIRNLRQYVSDFRKEEGINPYREIWVEWFIDEQYSQKINKAYW